MYQLPKLKLTTGLVHGFSEIRDGTMDFRFSSGGGSASGGGADGVLRSRKNFFASLGLTLENGTAMEVQHTTEIVAVTNALNGRGMVDHESVIKADALMTNEQGLFLFLLTADCLPIILYDPVKRTLALVHASRKNTPADFSGTVVRKMGEAYGTKPSDLIIGIGPAIHKESYIFDGAPLDLIGKNSDQLRAAGVTEEAIEVSPVDTCIDKNFFSHVRSHHTGEEEGRMATVVGLM